MSAPSCSLWLFALPAAVLTACGADADRTPPERTFAVTDHGARGDGKTLNTSAIQAAVDACARAGGGSVVITSGEFLSGAIFLKPGVQLRLNKGAVLKGSDDLRDYPVQETRIEGQ